MWQLRADAAAELLNLNTVYQNYMERMYGSKLTKRLALVYGACMYGGDLLHESGLTCSEYAMALAYWTGEGLAAAVVEHIEAYGAEGEYAEGGANVLPDEVIKYLIRQVLALAAVEGRHLLEFHYWEHVKGEAETLPYWLVPRWDWLAGVDGCRELIERDCARRRINEATALRLRDCISVGW